MAKAKYIQPVNSLGGFLLAARIAKGLTQRQLAAKTGLSDGHICHMETGRYEGRFRSIVKICNALGIDLNDAARCVRK